MTITITLKSGESFSKSFVSPPRNWKSVAMRLAPYGSDMAGCTFSKAQGNE